MRLVFDGTLHHSNIQSLELILLSPLLKNLQEGRRPTTVCSISSTNLGRLAFVIVVARRAILAQIGPRLAHLDNRLDPLVRCLVRRLYRADVELHALANDICDVLSLLRGDV